MAIEYAVDRPVSVEQFRQVLNASTLGERRPMDDAECLQGMIANSNLIVTAWDEDILVGIARSVTDFHYACYLSDLAVHVDYQRSGIGKQLMVLTQDQLEPKCKLILLAAPAADTYYERVGFTRHPRCWVLDRNERVGHDRK